jgi:hypothetical protein
MAFFGPNSHVFIIRVRSEPREIPGAPTEWRFWVEHLPSGDRQNLREFGDVLAFIRVHVPSLPVTVERVGDARPLREGPIDA